MGDGGRTDTDCAKDAQERADGLAASNRTMAPRESTVSQSLSGEKKKKCSDAPFSLMCRNTLAKTAGRGKKRQ